MVYITCVYYSVGFSPDGRWWQETAVVMQESRDRNLQEPTTSSKQRGLLSPTSSKRVDFISYQRWDQRLSCHQIQFGPPYANMDKTQGPVRDPSACVVDRGNGSWLPTLFPSKSNIKEKKMAETSLGKSRWLSFFFKPDSVLSGADELLRKLVIPAKVHAHSVDIKHFSLFILPRFSSWQENDRRLRHNTRQVVRHNKIIFPSTGLLVASPFRSLARCPFVLNTTTQPTNNKKNDIKRRLYLSRCGRIVEYNENKTIEMNEKNKMLMKRDSLNNPLVI